VEKSSFSSVLHVITLRSQSPLDTQLTKSVETNLAAVLMRRFLGPFCSPKNQINHYFSTEVLAHRQVKKTKELHFQTIGQSFTKRDSIRKQRAAGNF